MILMMKSQVTAFHKALLKIQDVFMKFRSGFKGKCSPIHFFWGGFDLALSFFSGRKAPKHPGGVPGMPDWVAEEAYCSEVSSSGFWTGNEGAYRSLHFIVIYIPSPRVIKQPKFNLQRLITTHTLKEFILPYS